MREFIYQRNGYRLIEPLRESGRKAYPGVGQFSTRPHGEYFVSFGDRTGTYREFVQMLFEDDELSRTC